MAALITNVLSEEIERQVLTGRFSILEPQNHPTDESSETAVDVF